MTKYHNASSPDTSSPNMKTLATTPSAKRGGPMSASSGRPADSLPRIICPEFFANTGMEQTTSAVRWHGSQLPSEYRQRADC